MTRSHTRCIFSLALVLCGAASSLLAQTTAPSRKNTGIIAGKITIKGKAAPGIVVGVRVPQSPTPYEPAYRGTTDQDGRYRIRNLPPGSYEVAPVAPAFVIFEATNSQGQLVALGEGEHADGIDFVLVRGGVITGKVADADGHPVVEQEVTLISADQQTGPRVPVYSHSDVQTDDRGIYRIFGLAAGHYKVSVGPGNILSRGRPSLQPSFYTQSDDSSNAEKAAVVDVVEGGEATNIDITLGRPAQTFAAGGRIVDSESGQPVGGASVSVTHALKDQRASYARNNFISNSKGEFKLENLPPGQYVASLLSQPDGNLESDLVTFEIVDHDVNGLLIKATKGSASVSGNVVLDNTDEKAVRARLLQLHIQAFIIRPSGVTMPNLGHTASINADGSFRLSGLESGILYLVLDAPDRSLLKGFTIIRTEQEGVVEPHNLELKSGDQITGIRLVVSFGNSAIQGVVTLAGSALPAGARVYLRLTKEGDTRQFIQSPQVDSRGHFFVQGIPAGLYSLEATLLAAGVASRPPPRAKQQVTVLDGEVTEVTIALENTKPE